MVVCLSRWRHGFESRWGCTAYVQVGDANTGPPLPGPRLAATTAANYQSNLTRHILPLLGDRNIVDVRPRLVAGFLRHLEAAGLGAATVRIVRTVLSAVMSFAVAMEFVESNPVMKVETRGATACGMC